MLLQILDHRSFNAVSSAFINWPAMISLARLQAQRPANDITIEKS